MSTQQQLNHTSDHSFAFTDESSKSIEQRLGGDNSSTLSSTGTSNLSGKQIKFNGTNNDTTANLNLLQDTTTTKAMLSSPISSNFSNAALPLSYSFLPVHASIDSIRPFVQILEDDKSPYMAVARACFLLNQFASWGSSNHSSTGTISHSHHNNPHSPTGSSQQPTTSSTATTNSSTHNNNINIEHDIRVHESSLFHVHYYASILSILFNTFINTSSSHTDRRCRILSLQSLSIISKSALVKLLSIPPSPQLLTCNTTSRDAIGNTTSTTGVTSSAGGTAENTMGMVHGLVDEISNDVVVAFIATILDDFDESVSSIAVECLGRLILDYKDDVLFKEVDSILYRSRSFHDDFFRSSNGIDGNFHHKRIVDLQDPTTNYKSHFYTDIQWRILESIIAPRIRRIVTRVSLYKRNEDKARTLPFLTFVMMFLYQTERARRATAVASLASVVNSNSYNNNNSAATTTTKQVFAKQWQEFDSTVLIKEYVDFILSPLLSITYDHRIQQQQQEHEISIGAARCTLQLLSVIQTKEVWVKRLHYTVHTIFYNHLQYIIKHDNDGNLTTNYSHEQKLIYLIYVLISIRGINYEDRFRPLHLVVKYLSADSTIPPIMFVPSDAGVLSPSLLLEDGYRVKPIRVGLWVDIALAFMLPDWGHTISSSTTSIGTIISKRIALLQVFLSENETIQSIVSSSSSSTSTSNEEAIGNDTLIDLAEEIIITFCAVASNIGTHLLYKDLQDENDKSRVEDDNRLKNSKTDNHVIVIAMSDGSRDRKSAERELWLRMSLILLEMFKFCLHWNPADKDVYYESFSVKESNEFTIKSDAILKLEGSCTLCGLAQKSYLELLKIVLLSTGIISPDSSLFSNFMEKSSFMSQTSDNDRTIENVTATNSYDFIPHLGHNRPNVNLVFVFMEKFLDFCTKDNSVIPSRRLRLSCFALLTDSWMSRCQSFLNSGPEFRPIDYDHSGPIDADDHIIHMSEYGIRELLGFLASEISNLMEGEKKRSSMSRPTSSNFSKPVVDATEELRFLLTCIACIESVAYTCHEWASCVGNSNHSTFDKEAATYILSICIVILKGNGKIPDDDDDDTSSVCTSDSSISITKSPRSKARITAFTSESANASRRIREKLKQCNEFGLSPTEIDGPLTLAERPEFSIRYSESSNNEHFCSNALWRISDELLNISSFQSSNLNHSRLSINQSGSNSSLPFQSILNDHLFRSNRFFPGDTYDFGYFTQLYRQVVCNHIQSAFTSSSSSYLETSSNSDNILASNTTEAASNFNHGKSPNPLRLSNTVYTDLKCNQGLTVEWPHSVATITGGSDPISIYMTYLTKHYSRYDGEIQWKLVVSVSLYNTTPVSIPYGFRLDLYSYLGANDDGDSDGFLSSLLPNLQDNIGQDYPTEKLLASAVYKNEVKSGENLIWEVVLDSWPYGENSLCVSVSFLDLEYERNTIVPLKVSTIESLSGDVNDAEKSADTSQDDFQSDNDSMDDFLQEEEEDSENGDTFDCLIFTQPLPVSPMIMLQPNPLVFYLNKLGDQGAFRFLWLSLPYCIPKFPLDALSGEETNFHSSSFEDEYLQLNSPIPREYATNVIAENASLMITGDYPNVTMKGWAFSTWFGKQVCIMAFEDGVSSSMNDGSTFSSSGGYSILIRGDDMNLLCSLLKSKRSREELRMMLNINP